MNIVKNFDIVNIFSKCFSDPKVSEIIKLMNKVANFIISFLKNCIMPLIKSNKLNANKKYNR